LPPRRALMKPDAVFVSWVDFPGALGRDVERSICRQDGRIARLGRGIQYRLRILKMMAGEIDERVIDQHESRHMSQAAVASAFSGNSFSRCCQNHSIVVFSPVAKGVRENPGKIRESFLTERNFEVAPTYRDVSNSIR
jgi:hypothetical protein